MNIIDKPGFYTSKAGKCEVVYAGNGHAFGYNEAGQVSLWNTCSGCCIWRGFRLCPDDEDTNITGPWTEPRKPVEAWAITTYSDDIFSFYRTRDAAEKSLQGFCNCRLIHLREVEDEKP